MYVFILTLSIEYKKQIELLMFTDLRNKGWDVFSNSYAEERLFNDHSEFCHSFQNILLDHSISRDEIITGGGGMHIQTQRLGSEFVKIGLKKANLEVHTQTVDSLTNIEIARSSTGRSHEIDHMHLSDKGNIAIEIEWNTKPVSFDRDLDAFRRFYTAEAIDVGIIVTRGESLQNSLLGIIKEFFNTEFRSDDYSIDIDRMISEFQNKNLKYEKPTNTQMKVIKDSISKGISPADAFARKFCSDKYGSSTTHWKTLIERFDRGGYKPVPLIFFGIPSSCITP